MNQDDIIFALDIGTRTVVGLVVEYTGSEYQILASEVVEHQKRAMLDGQIHNVGEVAQQVIKVKENLEERLGFTLERAAIAAAGRALETAQCQHSIEFESKRVVTSEDVKALEFSTIQKAQEELANTSGGSGGKDYHFVGYSVVEYQLDGIYIGELEGQKGSKISTTLIATFLPQVVVDSLFAVVNRAGLKPEYLTLEPIAAAGAVIPKDMYNFNLALVDIGAGTSDIALTRGGSMTGYAMVPVAGDEITEALAEHYLLDYHTGEILKRALVDGGEQTRVRNILSQEFTVDHEEAIKAIEPKVEELAHLISEEILKINEKAPQVVICIGGGSLTPLLVEKLRAALALPPGRVGIKKSEDITEVMGEIRGIDSTQAITPLGIALSAHKAKNRASIIEVDINQQPIQVFFLEKATVADALLAAGIDFKKINGRPGMGFTFHLNGKLRVIKGTVGRPAQIKLNGQEADLNTTISNGDKISFKPGKDGEDARAVISEIVPEESYQIKINDNPVEIKTQVYQNGKLVEGSIPVADGSEIEYNELETIGDGISQLYEVTKEKLDNEAIIYYLNGKKKYFPKGSLLILEGGTPVDLDRPLVDGLNLEVLKGKGRPPVISELFDTNRNQGEEIRIFFNKNELTIPVQRYSFFCNGEEVGADYIVSDGDHISYKPARFRVKEVFAYINYNPSNLIDNNFRLTVNGQPATLDTEVNDGDELLLKPES